MKWVAGFETAYLHWNGNCMAGYTRHTPETGMADNYDWAKAKGFAGARDSLPDRFNVYDRVAAAPWDFPIVWSLHHYGPPPEDPARHALTSLDAAGGRPTFLPVVEPGVGYAVSGLGVSDAVALAKEFIRALEGRAELITGDPIHQLAEWEWEATDELVASGQISAVGVHCYAHHLCVPLAEVIAAAKARYGLPVVLGETGYHDGHPGNAGRPHGCNNRHEWKAYVEREATGALWACWMPALPINWDGGEPWPSDWPQ